MVCLEAAGTRGLGRDRDRGGFTAGRIARHLPTMWRSFDVT